MAHPFPHRYEVALSWPGEGGATTFRALTARSGVAVRDYRCRARALLDKTPAGLVFTEIVLEVGLEADPGQADRLRALLQKAKTHCIVSNALKPEMRLEVEVREA